MEIFTTADKRLAVNALADNFRRGEAQADKPIIVIPKMRDGIDQSQLRWQMRGVSEQNTMAVQDLTYTERDGNLYFEWFVSSDFYAVPGLLELVFVGRNADSTITVKYLGSTPLRVYLAEEGDYTPPPDMLEKAAGYVEQAREISRQVKAAVVHAPKIISGTWHTWDMTTNAYIDTGVASTEPGPPGPQGGPGPQGPRGPKGDKPISGVDYNTPAERQELLDQVKAFKATFLLDGWQQSGNEWTQTASCPGMRAAYDTGAPWTYKTGNAATDAELQAGLNSICAGSVETLEEAIKATVPHKPTGDQAAMIQLATMLLVPIRLQDVPFGQEKPAEPSEQYSVVFMAAVIKGGFASQEDAVDYIESVLGKDAMEQLNMQIAVAGKEG